jgi:Notch-like protein
MSQVFKSPFPTIKYSSTTTAEIEKIVRSLKSRNAHGYDGISVKILKASSHFISSPLNCIFNRMLSTGTFPSRLKYAESKPIFKKGDKNKMVNFRPISLLTSFSKVFEKVIYTRLYQHTTGNLILANE